MGLLQVILARLVFLSRVVEESTAQERLAAAEAEVCQLGMPVCLVEALLAEPHRQVHLRLLVELTITQAAAAEEVSTTPALHLVVPVVVVLSSSCTKEPT